MCLRIENYGRNGLRVILHPDDLATEVESPAGMTWDDN
jgi:hypothetical protein